MKLWTPSLMVLTEALLGDPDIAINHLFIVKYSKYHNLKLWNVA